MTDIATFLSGVFLFESLTPEQIELFKSVVSLKRINRGDHLFSEGQPASSFFIVVSGAVKLYKLSAEGTEQILHIQKDGDLVAEAVIFDFQTYPAYCQAIESTELLRISNNGFRDLLRHFPEICFKIMEAYSRRLRQLLNKIEDLSLRDMKSRLAKYLIDNSTVEDQIRVCHLTLHKKDLAALMGTIPETLSRTLQFFKNENLIREEKHQIIILDAKRLGGLV